MRGDRGVYVATLGDRSRSVGSSLVGSRLVGLRLVGLRLVGSRLVGSYGRVSICATILPPQNP